MDKPNSAPDSESSTDFAADIAELDEDEFDRLTFILLKAAVIKSGGILDISHDQMDRTDFYDAFSVESIPSGMRIRLLFNDPSEPDTKA